MEQSRSEARFWPIFAAVTVTVILVAAIRWSLAHPYGIHWDEAQYFDDVGIDVQRLRGGMLLKLGGRILVKSWGRPPAYRLVALPFLALFGFQTVTARLVSLACFALSSRYIYLATQRIAGRAAGGFAALVFALSPGVVSASIWFSTDAPLYLATSAMLYYLFVGWIDESEKHPRNWVGLGVSIGLGLLSKASFVLLVVPVLAFWLILDCWGNLRIPKLTSQRKAGLLALLIATPWWLLNVGPAVATVHMARGFARDSLGTPSFATLMKWLNTVFQSLLGHGLSILIGLILLSCIVKSIVQHESLFSPLQKVALAACACAGVPILLAQLSGTNHLLRHISPSVIPLAIAVGVVADKTGWTRSWALVTTSSILFFTQLLMLVYPVVFPNTEPVDLGFANGELPWRVMARFDQWNWKQVQDISYRCGIESPKISYLGSSRVLDPPAIEYPWVAQITSTHLATFAFPDVTWLWRYEDGPMDWQKVMNSVGHSDIVLTAPHYIGEVRNKEDLDNQHNAEFAERLSLDPRFQGPIPLEMGRFEPVEVTVFLKKTLVCGSTQEAPAKQ